MKTDLERLLEASHQMLRMKDEATLSAEVIREQSTLIVSQRKEIALLHARLSAADVQLRRAARGHVPALLRPQAG